MTWYRCGGGSNAEDGNDITYPVPTPSQDNKLYSEADVNAIALALGLSLKVSEMATAVQSMTGGLHATRCIVHSGTYTEVSS